MLSAIKRPYYLPFCYAIIDKPTAAIIKLSATRSLPYDSDKDVYVYFFSGNNYAFTCCIQGDHFLFCKTLSSCAFFRKSLGIENWIEVNV